MTTYKHKNWEILIGPKRAKTDRIIHILGLSDKKKWTTREIYEKGKKLFRDKFHRDKNTVLRYLNTMNEIGMVEKDGRYWNLSPQDTTHPELALEKIVAKLDIDTITESLKLKNNWYHGIITTPDITLYGENPLVKVYFKEKLNNILKELRGILQDLYILNQEALEKYWNDHDQNEIYDVPDATEFDKNLINILNEIFVTKFSPAYIGFFDSQEEFTKRFTEKWGKDINPADTDLIFIDKDLEKKVLIKNGKITADYILPIAGQLKERFYPEESKGDLIKKLKNHHISPTIIEQVKKSCGTWMNYLLDNLYPLDYPLIIVNPKREYLGISRNLSDGFEHIIHNYLSRSTINERH